jgi:hypothetical protein
VGNNLYLGYSSDSTGTYQVSGDATLRVMGTEHVGLGGNGWVAQAGGLHTAHVLVLGASQGSVGSYELAGGELRIIFLDFGTWWREWGHPQYPWLPEEISSPSQLPPPWNTIVQGEYDGYASESDERIGYYGSGTFTQTGGTHTVSSDLYLGGDSSGSTGTYSLSGGTLSAGSVELGRRGAGRLDLDGSAGVVTVSGLMKLRALGSLSAVAGSTIEVAGDWENASTDGVAFGTFGLAAGSHFNMAGDGTTGLEYEVGAGDYGAIGPGYYANFALGDFQVVSGTTRLVDLFDNDPDASGTEALYVDVLRIADGATLALNGCNLYYHNWDQSAGWGGTLDDDLDDDGTADGFALWAPGPADFDENAAVGLGDFSLLAGVYGLTEGEPGWDANVDIDRNGAIGLGDFSLFAGLYGTSYAYGLAGAPAPEPAALSLLAVGIAMLARRRH